MSPSITTCAHRRIQKKNMVTDTMQTQPINNAIFNLYPPQPRIHGPQPARSLPQTALSCSRAAPRPPAPSEPPSAAHAWRGRPSIASTHRASRSRAQQRLHLVPCPCTERSQSFAAVRSPETTALPKSGLPHVHTIMRIRNGRFGI